jgi:hypothetical protein
VSSRRNRLSALRDAGDERALDDEVRALSRAYLVVEHGADGVRVRLVVGVEAPACQGDRLVRQGPQRVGRADLPVVGHLHREQR